MSDELITIPKLSAQIVFDALVHSMDFGSGFLGTEEVEALRGLAEALGVDPVVATPAEFAKGYPHAFKAMPDEMIRRVFTPYAAIPEPEAPGGYRTERKGQMPDFTPCQVGTWGRHCGKPEDDPIHQVGA